MKKEEGVLLGKGVLRLISRLRDVAAESSRNVRGSAKDGGGEAMKLKVSSEGVCVCELESVES